MVRIVRARVLRQVVALGDVEEGLDFGDIGCRLRIVLREHGVRGGSYMGDRLQLGQI